MSLINDALKRARQSQPPRPPPAGGPPLSPVESRPSGGLGWFLPLAIVLLVAVACFLIGVAVAKRSRPPATAIAAAPPRAAENPVPTPAVATKSPSPAPALPATPQNQIPPVPAPATHGAPPPVVAPTNAAGTSNAAGVAPPPPGPRLQGILFDPAAPRAIVDGQNVRVGDRVGRFRVKAISNTAVTLQAADGSVTNLKLGD